MNALIITRYAVAGFLGALVLTGCAHDRGVSYQERAPMVQANIGTEVIVDQAPPAPIAEQITISPGPEFLWIPGVWAWNGRWTWDHGHWEHRPHPGAVWVPHRYIYRNGAHVFVRGGWR